MLSPDGPEVVMAAAAACGARLATGTTPAADCVDRCAEEDGNCDPRPLIVLRPVDAEAVDMEPSGSRGRQGPMQTQARSAVRCQMSAPKAVLRRGVSFALDDRSDGRCSVMWRPGEGEGDAMGRPPVVHMTRLSRWLDCRQSGAK